MIRPVRSLPDRVLKMPASPASRGQEEALIRDLIDTMGASPACVGLAAPQIGVPQRVLVVDVSAHRKTTVSHGLIVLVDPVVVDTSGREIGREGCMSVPDFTAAVARSTRLVVRGKNAEGLRSTIVTEGFEARALQHEIDHLDGP